MGVYKSALFRMLHVHQLLVHSCCQLIPHQDKSACLLAPLCPNEELELGVGRMKLQELVHRGDEHVAEYQVLRP